MLARGEKLLAEIKSINYEKSNWERLEIEVTI